MNHVDFHCHLDLYPDFEAAVRAAEAAGVYTLTVTTTPRAWPKNYELTRATKFIRAALGIHPQLVEQFPKDIEIWEQYIDQARFVGEVGLDASPRHYKSLALQEAVFDHVLKRCARAAPKVLTVHSVRTAKLVLDRLERFLSLTEHSVVLHWFTGSVSELKRAIELGCYFSVNAQMLSGERGRNLIKHIPIDRLLTETDGPFTQFAGKPAHPSDVAQTVKRLAMFLGATSGELGAQVNNNLRTVLNHLK